MKGLDWLAGGRTLWLLRGMLYAAIIGAGLQVVGLARVGNLVLAVVAVAFGGLVVALIERSRRCLD